MKTHDSRLRMCEWLFSLSRAKARGNKNFETYFEYSKIWNYKSNFKFSQFVLNLKSWNKILISGHPLTQYFVTPPSFMLRLFSNINLTSGIFAFSFQWLTSNTPRSLLIFFPKSFLCSGFVVDEKILIQKILTSFLKMTLLDIWDFITHQIFYKCHKIVHSLLINMYQTSNKIVFHS